MASNAVTRNEESELGRPALSSSGATGGERDGVRPPQEVGSMC